MSLRKRIARVLGSQLRQPGGPMGRALGYLMSFEHRHINAWALPQLEVQPTDHVLDLGCGPGRAVRLLAGMAPQGFVAGVDHSPAMVAQARRLNRALIAAGRVEITPGTVEQITYPDERFDRVSAIETFMFWRNPLEGLSEALRVLKPSGRLAIVVEASKHSPKRESLEAASKSLGYNIYSGDEIVDLARSAGFREASFSVNPEEGRGWVCALASK